MKTKILFLSLFLFYTLLSNAQVGINNTDPKSMMDITASNVATPANTDGILIPRVDEFPATNPTTDQNGMLIFATGSGSIAEGFYWWDFSTLTWTPFVKKIDDLSDGKSDIDGSDDGSSLFLGIDAGAADDASHNKNIGIGYQALNANVGVPDIILGDGEENIAIGYQALLLNSSGDNNIAIGVNALDANTIGYSNLAIGNNALTKNVGGYGNMAIGRIALRDNTSGRNGTAIGEGTLNSNTTGNSNTAVGSYAVARNTVGQDNTGLGNHALRGNVFGNDNLAVGDYAGRSLDDDNVIDLDNDNNVFLGAKAGEADLNSSNNVYIGFESGGGIYQANDNSGTPENKSGNVFIGHRSGFDESGSNKLYIENSNSATPLIYGEFDNDILRVNGTLQVDDPASGGYALPAADGTADQVLTTDGSGAVTWEDATGGVALAVARTTVLADQTITTANTWTKINFDTVDFDLNNDFDDITNDEFVVPADGIYRVTAMYTSTTNLNNNDVFGIRIRAGATGSTTIQSVNHRHINENTPVVRQITTLVEMNSGDKIIVQARVSVISGLIISSDSTLTSFDVERIR